MQNWLSRLEAILKATTGEERNTPSIDSGRGMQKLPLAVGMANCLPRLFRVMRSNTTWCSP